MKITKISLFVSFFILLFSGNTSACSCDKISFCEFYSKDNVKIALKGIVIKRKNYGNDNHAVYLKVLKKFREEEVFSDTIKIYGGTDDWECDLDVLKWFEFGDTILGAFDTRWAYSHITNPDSLSEKLTQLNPGLCGFYWFKVNNDKIRGWIDTDIYEYPIDLFETGIQDCDFEKSVIQKILCESDDFYFYPNPSTTSKIQLKGDFWRLEIERVRIFSPSGDLLDDLTGLRGFLSVEIHSEKFIPGLNILEIHCEGRIFLKKVFMKI